jgi:hypothetical protein
MGIDEMQRASERDLSSFFGRVLEGLIATGSRDLTATVMAMDRSSLDSLRESAAATVGLLDREVPGWREEFLSE